MGNNKFDVAEICDMPTAASALLSKLGAGDMSGVWNSVAALDGAVVRTLQKSVVLRVDGGNVSYDGQDDDGMFGSGRVLDRGMFELLAGSLPYHPNIEHGDLFRLCESRAACDGAEYCPARLLKVMGYNLGQTALTVIGLFYGLVYALLR